MAKGLKTRDKSSHLNGVDEAIVPHGFSIVSRFHDLTRTFGLNLIKQRMSIYKVSKLLGHKSVRTTV